MRLTLASQVAYERFSFTAVPQTDLKHFDLESSLGKAWLPGKSSLGGRFTRPSVSWVATPETPDDSKLYASLAASLEVV